MELVNKSYASLFTTFFAHSTRFGYEDGLNFWGGSTIFDPRGELVTQAPYQVEHLLASTLDLGLLRRTRARLPLLRDERTGLALRELGRIISSREGGWKGHND